jgi:hypothetical protein
MKDSWTVAILSLVVLCFMALILYPYREISLAGQNDFAAFYAGGKLLDTRELYDRQRLHEEEKAAIGTFSEHHGYIRLPFHAAAVWPLTRLPYRWAYLIWQLAALAALIAFVVLWRPPGGHLNVLFTALSLPAFTSIANGQDCTFLLLFLAVAALLYRRDEPLQAGLVFSLCAIKFHLFLLTPLLILGRRDWRFAKGLLAGGGVLAVVSFAVAGWNWPVEFIDSAMNPASSPRTAEMANLHGVLSQVPGGGFVEILLSATVVAGVWLVCRRMPFAYSLAAVLIGGFLLSMHAYLPDLVITLPAGLSLIALSTKRSVRLLAFVLLATPIHIAMLFGYPASLAGAGILLLLVYAMTYEAWQTEPANHANVLPSAKPVESQA